MKPLLLLAPLLAALSALAAPAPDAPAPPAATSSNSTAATPLAPAAAKTTAATSAHPFVGCDNVGNKVFAVAADGKILWEYPCQAPQDCWALANGNFLFCYQTGAVEITPEKKVVWEYKAPARAEVHAIQPLPEGRVMLVECGSSRLIEVDRAGAVVKEIKLVTDPTITTHNQFRGSRKTTDGRYLVSFKGEHKVVEFASDGKILREIPVPGDVHEVVPLPNGHLLIACGEGHKVIELDKDLKVVWEINENDLPDNPLRLAAGLQRLPNGNTVIGNYLGHGFVGKQPMFLEVTPDKKVVWQFDDREHFKSIQQLQLLDVPGDPIKGEILR